MANNFSTATLGLGVDTKDFYKDIGDIQQQTEKALNNMKLSADAFSDKWGTLTDGIKDTKRIVSGILVSQGFYALSNALLDAGAAALNFSMNMETAAISMEYFVKGADKIAKSQAFLRTMNEFAARTPFSTEEAISLSKYMQAMGVSMNTTKSFLKVITDTAAATGATEQNLQRIVFGLGQMMTKGRLANEEIRQLANANIPIYDILKEQLNLTGAQISNIGRYWVDADKAVVAILKGLENRYGGAADRIAETVTGMTDTIFDNAKIIAQIAGSGVYESLADKMSIVRDVLDRYREIATERGSAGLFDQILRDLDASGKIGTEILALIGNTKQLGAALRDLYVAGKPLLGLFGKSLYSSISIAQITLTAMARTADVVVEALNEMGLTTGNTAEVLSSLFVAYHAAKWMGTLGMAARAAGYNAFQAAQSIYTIIPASLQASASAKIATASLVGLAAAGLTAWGMFSAINNLMAGLDTKTSAGNLFPDDYEEAMAKYNAAMEDYNERIASLTDEYNAPFTEIEDGTTSAVDGLKDVEKASSKAAKSVKNDWLAAFDEVYAIPKDRADDLSGLDDLLGDKVDFGASLIPAAFKFPKIDGIKLEMPKREDFWSDGILDPDSEVFDSSWWKSFLPLALTGAAMTLGKILAGNSGMPGASLNGTGKTSSGGAFQTPKQAADALKGLQKAFTEAEKSISKTLSDINKGIAKTPAETERLQDLLKLKADEALKIQAKINDQMLIAGKIDKTLQSDILAEAKKLSDGHMLKRTADSINRAIAEAGGTDITADFVRNQVKALTKDLQGQYEKYVLNYGGATPDIEDSVKGLINTRGLEQRATDMVDSIKRIRTELINNNYDVLKLSDDVKEALKVNTDVLKEMKTIGQDTGALTEATSTIKSINKLLKQVQRQQEIDAELAKLNTVKSTAEVRKGEGSFVSGIAVTDRIDALTKQAQRIADSVKVQRNLVDIADPENIDKFNKLQEQVNINRKFDAATRVLTLEKTAEIIKPIKQLSKYGKEMMLGQREGVVEIKSKITLLGETVSGIKDAVQQQQIGGVLKELSAAYRMSLDTKTPVGITVNDVERKLLDAVRQYGETIGADTNLIVNASKKISENLGKVSADSKVLNKIVEKIEASRVGAPMRKLDNVLDRFDDVIAGLSETSTSIAKFDKQVNKAFEAIRTDFPAEFAAHEAELRKMLRDAHFDMVDTLSDKQKGVVNPEAYQYTSDPEMNKYLKQMKDDLAGLNRRSIRNAVRRGYLDQRGITTPEQQAVFDLSKMPLSAGEIAGTFGNSSYGQNIAKMLISNMTEEIKTQRGLSLPPNTVRSEISMGYGRVGEVFVGKSLDRFFSKIDKRIRNGDIFVTPDGKLQAQLDYLVYEKGRFSKPVDAKVLFNFEDKIGKLLKNATKTDEGYYRLSSKYFKDLVTSAEDIAWQMAGQTQVMGTSSAYLGVVDAVRAGIMRPDASKLAQYDVANKDSLKAMIKEIGYMAAKEFNRVGDSLDKYLTVVEIEVPKWAKLEAKNRADLFWKLQWDIIDKYAMGMPITELVKPINMLGEKLDRLGTERWATARAYEPPSVNDPVLSSVLRDIQLNLKTPSPALASIGSARLSTLIERIEDAIWNGALEGEVRRVPLDNLMTGVQGKNYEATGTELMALKQELVEFQDIFGTRTSTLTTQLSDLIKAVNKAADQGKKLTDALYTTAQGKPRTLEDLLRSIISTDKSLTGGSQISQQAYGMLNAGMATPMTNPYAYADLPTYLQHVSGTDYGYRPTPGLNKALGSGLTQLGGSGAFNTLVNPSDDKGLSIGNRTYIVNSEATTAFWKKVEETWTKTQTPAYTAHGEAARAYNAANVVSEAQKTEATLKHFFDFLDTVDDAAEYKVSGQGIMSGKMLKKVAGAKNVSSANGVPWYDITDAAGKTVYTPYTPPATSGPVYPNYSGPMYSAYSPGWSPKIANDKFRVGKYVDVAAELKGSAHNPEAINTAKGGIYADVGSKRLKVSGTAIDNALGIAGIALTVAQIVKETKDTKRTFEQEILPLLPASERDAAKERQKNMGITGWTEGSNAGALFNNFITQYGEMTKEERLFWGSLATRDDPDDFSIFGTSNAGAMRSALSDVVSLVNNPKLLDTPITQAAEKINLDDETRLITALAEGVENSPLAALTDYLMISGDTSSDIAIEFYKQYGQYMEDIIKPKYGIDKEWLSAVDLLMKQNNEDVQKLFAAVAPGAKSAADLSIAQKQNIDTYILALQDNIEAQILPVLQARATHNEGTTPLTGDYARVVTGLDLGSLNSTAEESLKEILGISFESLGENMSKISIDSDEINDNIIGWTKRLPDNISLDGTTLSAQDVEILASAGIQVNGDGTVTFMKAMNENVTGTDRSLGLTISDVSKSVLDELGKAGLSFEFGDAETKLNLSVEEISEKMQSAMFRLNKDLTGQISDDMRDALSGLGEVLDSGYVNITNAAVLNGEITIEEYLNGMGTSIDRLSPELQESLRAIDAVIAQGGEATKQTIATWADGVVMPSPIDEAKLTDEMRLAFEAIGITFVGSGEEFMMVVNKLSNDLKDGMVLIPAETWNRIDSEIVDALETLGVSTTETAAGIMVDLSGTMDNGVGSIIELFANRPDLWDQIPEQFKETFAAAGFSVEDGMVKINMAALDGMVALGTEWYTKWSDMPQDVIDAMGAALYQTEDGLLKLEQVTADTVIPESIEEGVIKPFSELPAELRDRLTGGDASVVAELENAKFKITGATNDAFVGAVNAVSASFSTMNSEAADGAAQLAETIAAAMAHTSALSNVKIKKNYNPFANKDKPTIKGSPGSYTIVYGGMTYEDLRATDKEAARKMVEEIRGEKIPGFKFGGIVDTDGLYRAGEFGRKEGIIPLENKQGLQVIGNTILNSLAGSSSPVQRSLLSSMVGNSTGGAVVNSAADNMHAYFMTQKNIQASSQQQQAASNKPVVYVQTMIADKQGLRELEKKLEIVRLERS